MFKQRRRSYLEDERDRAVVHELDLHPLAEDALLDGDAELAKRVAEAFVDGLRVLGTCRARERRTVPLSRVLSPSAVNRRMEMR